MPQRCPELHCPSHVTIDGFSLHRSARIEFAPIPLGNAPRGTLDATTQAALVCSFLLLERVERVALHSLDGLDVNRAFRLLNHLFPARLSGQWRTLTVTKVKVGFQLRQLRIDGKVRAHKIPVPRAAHAVLFQPQLKDSNLSCFVVAEQPIVRVTSVVTIQHDSDIVINRVMLDGNNGGYANDWQLGDKRSKASNRGFRDHQARRVNPKVVIAGDYARQAVHQNAMA